MYIIAVSLFLIKYNSKWIFLIYYFLLNHSLFPTVKNIVISKHHRDWHRTGEVVKHVHRRYFFIIYIMSIQLELSMEIQKKSRFILKNCAETNGASVSSENPNRIASIILI
jgi:hypothetical protein